MSTVWLLALRGLFGGLLVVVFSLVGEVVRPKAFSGLFSSGPSVAVASLALTIGFETAAQARQESIGMVVGGIGMAAGCAVAALVIPRAKAIVGSLAAWATWGVLSLGLYWAVFVGAR